MIRCKLIALTILIIGLLILSGCATKPSVFSDFDARHDFTGDKTFTWAEDPPMLRSGTYPVSAIAEYRMTNAIKNELVAKGYVFVENIKDADLAMLYTMGARAEIEIIDSQDGYYSHYTDWGWGAYYFPYFVHFPYDHWGRRYRLKEPRLYTGGTIAFDVFDTKTKKPIWHSKASKRLSKKDLDSHARNAPEIAAKLLQHFPLIGCEPEVTRECRPFSITD